MADRVTSSTGKHYDDPRWQLVQRIASSSTFRGSRPLQDFLLFIAEKAIFGHTEEIKEQTVGSNVLRRHSNFDPATDNIVRVRARQLRQKLDAFYASEGANESIRVSVPRGSYIPLFAVSAEEALQNTKPEKTDLHPPPYRRALPSWVPWSIVAMLATVCFLLAVALSKRDSTSPPTSRKFWEQLFVRNQRTVAIVSDMGGSFWQKLHNRELSLQEYLETDFTIPGPGQFAPPSFIFENNFVSLSVVTFLSGAVPIGQELGARVTTKTARQANINDFKQGNVIVIGARPSNPWMQLFETHLHYPTERLPDGSTHFRSRINSSLLSVSREKSYAVIALLRNLNNTANVLLIEGLGMEATDGATEFLVSPQTCALLVNRLMHSGLANRPFEALLQLTPVSGGSANVRLLEVQRPLS